MNTQKLVNLSTRHPRLTVRTLATLMAIKDNEGCSVSELSHFIMNFTLNNAFGKLDRPKIYNFIF